jgi:phage gp29-like protein
MANPPVLLGPDGQPIQREVLTSEIAGPSMLGMRSPFTAHPVVGLNPRSLAALLREADLGDPMRYLELAEVIEERDAHYLGVLGTRKRAVTQLDITVEAASDDAEHVAHADYIRNWLSRDFLTDELFHVLDAVGKGFSLTEIIWDTSEGNWWPARLENRDPRWFRFSQVDGRTPLLRDNAGDKPLPPFKFIRAEIVAKSGLPVRSGIARVAAWGWMFKAFTLRDWAIFTQTFGQPVRVGKYPFGASEADKSTLFDAVSNIAGDCAAIIPESMLLEFVESRNVGAGSDLYEKRTNWLDKQISKAVLGQTATTDAETGGLGSGKEHRQVQEDIERADAKALSAVINRDLVRACIQLEYGPQPKYPKVKIGRIEEEDNTGVAEDLDRLVRLGLRVQASEVRDRFGWSDPDEGAEVLTPPPESASSAVTPLSTAAQSTQPSEREIEAVAAAAERMAGGASDEMIDGIRAIVARCNSFSELQAELRKYKPAIAEQNFAGLLRMALVFAQLAGRAEIADAAASDHE